MFPTQRLQTAFCFAAQLHADQVRKGTEVPYLTHLMAVSALVGEYGGDEDLMIAGLLHDTLEDQPEKVTIEHINQRFGWRVGHIVVACSDCMSHPKPPWEQRKKAYLLRLRDEGPDVKLVSAADKLHNGRTLVRDTRKMGDAFWSRFNATKEQQCWYLRECVTAMRQNWHNLILDELEETVEQMEKMCGIPVGGLSP